MFLVVRCVLLGLSFIDCSLLLGFCRDLQRRRIHAKAAQKHIGILAREIPQSGVDVSLAERHQTSANRKVDQAEKHLCLNSKFCTVQFAVFGVLKFPRYPLKSTGRRGRRTPPIFVSTSLSLSLLLVLVLVLYYGCVVLTILCIPL